MKKIIALVLALAMVALCAVASATTITINQNATDGVEGPESYNIYKIFDVTKKAGTVDPVTTDANVNGDGGTAGFSYTIASGSPWVAKLGSFSGDTWTSATNQTYVTLAKIPGDTTKYNVIAGDGLNTTAEAKAFASYLLANKGTIAATGTATSDASGVATYDGDDGYYLISSTLGTNLILATSNMTINTKNEYVTDSKTRPDNDYNVGDLVPYTITVNLPATVDYTKTVTVHDTMSNVLSLISDAYDATTAPNGWKATVKNSGADDSTAVAFAGATLATGKTNNHDSSTHAVGSDKVGYDFVLDISGLAPASGNDPVAKVITITYKAELTSAALADTDYVNTEFTNYSQYTTEPTTVIVRTYDFDLDKTFAGIAEGDQNKYEATFALFGSDGTTAINLKEETAYISYVKGDSDDGATTNTFKVKGGTTVDVRGLDEGTYIVKEISTSNGFNVMTNPITVVIADGGAVTYSFGSTTGSGNIPVENQSGALLPSTGGIGTTIFYIIGGVLLIGAAVILVARRKAHD